ncbi:MAG TPA: NAD(P)/FAD-dependent oxidoreductase [Steroidobacteraceae bacterium]|nr:NAD(P)/FAD-dependent oxidoreductase [Steroidobacteraceae bacterium]
MTEKSKDHLLGMDQPISRRDFLNGVALAVTASLPLSALGGTAPADLTAAQDTAGYYPPLLTGLRGSHPGSFEVAHALHAGQSWPPAGAPVEDYDLIIVGAGISGLAAAHFYRAKTSPQIRILILDNHDDFGGHAKRNEFHLSGELHLMNGGTLECDSPRPYGPIPAALLSTLGIDMARLVKTTQHPKFYEQRGLKAAAFFDQETFGADKLVVGIGQLPFKELLSSAPLSARAREQIAQIQDAKIDYLPGLTSAEKKQRLSRISYEAFLRDVVHAEPAVLRFYHARTKGEWGVGTDAVSALDCWGFGLPGFQGLGLAKGSISRMGYTPAGYEDTGGSLRLHFPDGNATIARLLVRNLLPAAVPGSSVEDVITSRVDYAQLDIAPNPVRLRLNSTAIRVRRVDDSKPAGAVEVAYVRGGQTFKARAKGTVLACYNMMIPDLCPELPEAQKSALRSLVKTPLVYTTVALRNWQAFQKLGVHEVYAPGSYHTSLRLNPHVNIGAYRSSRSPEGPILLHMVRTPCKAGLPEHDQNRAGRMELLTTSFETFERNIREQLNRMFSSGGFAAARDITAITVNRWPHGYAPEYNPLFDPDLPESQHPNVVGRARLGQITIANSDAGGAAYTDSAINQGHRAVSELLRPWP